MVLLIFGFLLGLAVGSFLNVVILRGARGENFSGRSRCESCGKTLSWHELIPILSFCLQKGRCRSCGSALSWQYPLVELGTGALFALTTIILLSELGRGLTDLSAISHWPLAISYLLSAIGYWLLAIAVLSSAIVIFVSDLRWRIIPNGAVLTLLLAGLAIRLSPLVLNAGNSSFAIGYLPFAIRYSSLLWDFGTAIAIALFFAAIWFLSRGRGMGFGDAKLVLATSLVLGFPESVMAVLLAFWIGAAVGILLILFRYKSWKDQIPFGPYILVGAAIVQFFYENLVQIFGGWVF